MAGRAGPCGALLAAALSLLLVGRARGEEPRRIVSLAPSLTETVFALGLGERLVGVSVYCDDPPEARKIDRVGTFLTPRLEAIVAKRPDVILGVPTPGNRDAVESLRALGLRVVVVDPRSVAQVEESMVVVGRELGREAEGRALAAGIERRLAAVREKVAGAAPRRTLMVVGQSPLIAVGSGTLQDELIRIAGGVNVAAAAGGAWPSISLEFAVASAPEVIIDTTMGNEERAGAGAALEFWRPFAVIPAVRDGRVHGHMEYALLHPGPRVAEAAETIARFVHPERFP